MKNLLAAVIGITLAAILYFGLAAADVIPSTLG